MRFRYLDVLKAIAIIAVVLYHSGFLTYGYLGVDLFLVIAGYLTTKSLCSKILVAKTSTFGEYFDFEVSRLVRLLPVLLVASIVCMAIGYWTMLPDDYENLSESAIASNTFVNNILASITTKNYWAVTNDYKPLMHTWYVGLLMQFYLIYPLVFFFAKLDKKNSQRAAITIISVLAIISLLVYVGTNDISHRFYYLPSRFYEFAVGGIVALIWNPKEKEKPFYTWFVYLCYVLLLLLFVVNKELIPANLKLILVVAISVVLIMSSNILENEVTANRILAKVGAASYSIFIWHQVFLAFYRYTISEHFTIFSYIAYIGLVAFLSWFTYKFIEQKVNEWLKEGRSKIIFYTTTIIVFLGLCLYSGVIYLRAGVVRDVPELYISKDNIHRGMHAEYCDRVYKYDKSFETDKPHWLVIGNSFGRDFVNTILESDIAEKIEVSYIFHTDYNNKEKTSRYANADRIFISTLGINEEYVSSIELMCLANGFPPEKLVIVGEKNFGECNGQIYVRRNTPKYFALRTVADKEMVKKNSRLKSLYGDRFLDLISMVIDDKGTVPVFSLDHHYISQDCEHFSKGGAVYFGQLINWKQYLN